MRFLADMGVSIHTVTWLRQQGHDAVHLREEGLQRLPDEEILVKACAERRTLLTMDLDFSYLLAVSGGTLPNVILFRLNDERSEAINKFLVAILAKHRSEIENGTIITVTETSICIRRLPIK